MIPLARSTTTVPSRYPPAPSSRPSTRKRETLNATPRSRTTSRLGAPEVVLGDVQDRLHHIVELVSPAAQVAKRLAQELRVLPEDLRRRLEQLPADHSHSRGRAHHATCPSSTSITVAIAPRRSRRLSAWRASRSCASASRCARSVASSGYCAASRSLKAR